MGVLGAGNGAGEARLVKCIGGSQSGSSIAEFCILAPVIILLLYGVQDLHDRIERRTRVHVAVRNLAIVGPRGLPMSHQKESVQRDLGVSGARVTASHRILSRSRSSQEAVRAGDYSLDRAVGSYEEDDEGYRAVAKVEGALARVAGLIDQLQEVGREESPLLFVRNRGGVGSAEVHLAHEYGPVRKSLSAMGVDLGESHVERFYRRFETGYHPDEFQNSTLLGFVLGSTLVGRRHWGAPSAKTRGGITYEGPALLGKVPDGFVAHCLMHFGATESCAGFNWFGAMVISTAIAKGVVQVILDLFGGNAPNAAAKESLRGISLVGRLARTLSNEAAKQGVDALAAAGAKALDDVAVRVEGSIKNAIGEKGVDMIVRGTKGTLSHEAP